MFGDGRKTVGGGDLLPAAGPAPFGWIVGPILTIIAIGIERAGSERIIGEAGIRIGTPGKDEKKGTKRWEPDGLLHDGMMRCLGSLATPR